MSMGKLLFTLLAFVFIVCNGETHSRQEYLQMKRELRRLNKPPVKIIKTKYGDTYDCVDIYKQPGLDHPLLKNHTVQLAPSIILEAPRRNNSGSSKEIDIALPDGAQCPEGSVPLLRLTMEHLIRQKSMPRRGKHLTEIGPDSNQVDSYKHLYAVERKPEGVEIIGFRARFNVWAPLLATTTMASFSQMWLYAGPRSSLNTLESGFMVNPTIYGGFAVYLFTYFTPDGYRTGCFDRQCGFVLAKNNIPIPMMIRDVSVYDGKQQELLICIIKDPSTKHWWLLYGDYQIPVGYWPESLFPYMNNLATGFDFGGEVASLDNLFPEMGSGNFAEGGYGRAAFISEVQVYDSNNQLVDAPKDTNIQMSSPRCYNIIDNLPSINPLGRHIFYGGPGGTDCAN